MMEPCDQMFRLPYFVKHVHSHSYWEAHTFLQ